MHRRTNRMSICAPATVLVAALVAWPVAPARAQEMALPAVDDSPSAQLVVEQAGDQAKANPREAVRLLVQALDLLQIVIFEVRTTLVGGPPARSKSTVNHYNMIFIINK